ncbi:MAG: cupin-like domain-containing protein [archaeon]|nr:cupin-like domain-containing protein [archaeon]
MSNGVGPSWLTSPLPEEDLASLREDLRAFDSAVQQTIAELEGFALFDEAEESPCGEAAALLELCWQALDSPPTGDASPALALSEACWKRLQEHRGWPNQAWQEAFVWAGPLSALQAAPRPLSLALIDKALAFCPPAGPPALLLQRFSAILDPPQAPSSRDGVPSLFPSSLPAAPPPSPHPRRTRWGLPSVTHPLPECSPEALPQLIAAASHPVVLRGAAALWRWRAGERWADGLASGLGHRLVPVEFGSACGGELPREEFRSLAEFAEMLSDPTLDPVPYLAQHCLFDQFPQLRQDFAAPPFLMPAQVFRVNGWLGPAGTITELHTDTCDNLFVQVLGFKYIRLYAPDQSDHLYAPLDRSNFSPVTCEDEQLDSFPDARHARFQDTILEPGDAVFFPALHWHYLRALSPSFSVNFWLADDH